MTALQKFSKKLEEEASDHERSILLVDIMNVMGFSKGEREIHRHGVHLLNVLVDIFHTTDKFTSTLTGSTSESMCGGICGHRRHHDFEIVFPVRDIKQYTPRANNNNNPPLLLLHETED